MMELTNETGDGRRAGDDAVLHLRLGADRRITRACARTSQVTGQPAHALVGQRFERLLAGDLPRTVVDEMWRRGRHQLVSRVGLRLEAADGSRFWGVAGLCPLHRDGQVVSYLLSILVPEVPRTLVLPAHATHDSTSTSGRGRRATVLQPA